MNTMLISLHLLAALGGSDVFMTEVIVLALCVTGIVLYDIFKRIQKRLEEEKRIHDELIELVVWMRERKNAGTEGHDSAHT